MTLGLGTTTLGLQGLKKEMVTMVEKIEMLEVHNRFVSQLPYMFSTLFINGMDFQVVPKGIVLILKMWLS